MKGLWIKQNVMALCYRQSCYPLKGNGNSTLRIYWWQPSKSWRWEYNPVNLEWIPLSPWRTDLQQIFQGVVWNAVLFPVSKIFPGFDSTKKRKLVLTIIKHEEIEVLISSSTRIKKEKAEKKLTCGEVCGSKRNNILSCFWCSRSHLYIFINIRSKLTE